MWDQWEGLLPNRSLLAVDVMGMGAWIGVEGCGVGVEVGRHSSLAIT